MYDHACFCKFLHEHDHVCLFLSCVTPHHQMRHKSQIQKLRFRHNVIEENTSFEMMKKLCFYHNQKLNYNLRNALYCGVGNMRKMGSKNCPSYHLNVYLH